MTESTKECTEFQTLRDSFSSYSDYREEFGVVKFTLSQVEMSVFNKEGCYHFRVESGDIIVSHLVTEIRGIQSIYLTSVASGLILHVNNLRRTYQSQQGKYGSFMNPISSARY